MSIVPRRRLILISLQVTRTVRGVVVSEFLKSTQARERHVTPDVKASERVPELLFNLASSDRLTLLKEIAARKQRMANLSKTINASVPECHRHLARLSEAGMIRKNSEGLYETTSVGNTILKLIPSLQLILEQKDYFLSHDLSFLPRGFLESIGVLATADRVNHISLVLEHIKRVVAEARNYIWLISDHLFPQWPGIATNFQPEEIPVKLICERTINPKVISEYKSRLPHSEISVLKEVKFAMAINETTAGVCFPTISGQIDFGAGFAGKDLIFRSWCTDLFEHYWSESRRIHSPSR
jgi:predicted transcriptional regulator